MNSLLRLLKNGLVPDDKKQDAMRQLLEFLARADYSQSSPVIGGRMGAQTGDFILYKIP